MAVDTRTDLDFLTELMRAKQRVVAAERDKEEAAAELKSANNALDSLLDKLEPHVQLRRDQLSLPKFPGLDPDPEDGADDDEGGGKRRRGK
jgi:outer membrane protein TolC